MITPTPINPEKALAFAVSRRRCLTLLEVLVALALLAGLTALVLPSMLDRLDERAFETAADNASEQLMMARAHAQATGEPVEVTYSPSTGQVLARVYAPWSNEIDVDSSLVEPGTSPLRDPASRSGATATPAAQSSANVSASNAAGDRGLANPEPSSARDIAIAEPWATRVLGHGISIARQPTGFPFVADKSDESHQAASPVASVNADGDTQTLEDLMRGQEVRLAVFMPDGSALVGDDVFLNDQSGRCGRLSVNPWSGLPMFVRLADLAARNAARDDDGRDYADAEPAGESSGDVDDLHRGPQGDKGASKNPSRGAWGDENDD